jgi:hypothetical protein
MFLKLQQINHIKPELRRKSSLNCIHNLLCGLQLAVVTQGDANDTE